MSLRDLCYHKYMNFKDKVILITGSSSGIGHATALKAKEYGATVVIHGKQMTPELQSFAKELGDFAVSFDVTDKEAVKAGVDEVIKKYGRIDALINCVGIPKRVPFMESVDEDWLDVFRVNVLGIVHVCQEVIPHMQSKKYGRIVNIASVRAHDDKVSVCGMPYSITKAAVKSLSAGLAKQYAPHIAVNSISPGYTNTAFAKTWSEETWKHVKNVLIGRIGEPHEIAEAILFLASDNASFITGTDLIVDGGLMKSVAE